MKRPQKVKGSIPTKDVELVLAAGGIKGYGHIGALKELIRFGITFSVVTGVSVGSVIAAFLTNGYTPEQILEIFENSVGQRYSLKKVLRLLSKVPDPLQVMLGGWMNLYPAVRDMVEEYDLKPNSRLRLVACDLFGHRPVPFEWTDDQFETDAEAYDAIAFAIASSCSLPPIFQPQKHNGRYLIDGALWNHNPVDFCKGPAIVISFSQATEMPKGIVMPWDLYFSWREIFLPLGGNQKYVDPDKNLVIEIGLPDVAGLNMGVSRAKRLAMVTNGESITKRALEQAKAEGRLLLAA